MGEKEKRGGVLAVDSGPLPPIGFSHYPPSSSAPSVACRVGLQLDECGAGCSRTWKLKNPIPPHSHEHQIALCRRTLLVEPAKLLVSRSVTAVAILSVRLMSRLVSVSVDAVVAPTPCGATTWITRRTTKRNRWRIIFVAGWC